MLSHLLSMIANRLIFSSIQTEPLCLVLVTCHRAPWWTSSSLQACVTLTAQPCGWEDCPAPSLEGLPAQMIEGKVN